MRDVAVIGFGQRLNEPRYETGNDIEILIEPIQAALDDAGLTRDEIDFTTGGSNDFLAGRAFAFVRALDAVGIYPAKEDSHLEMDGAWALYEAWIRLQLGDIDTALVYALGKTSLGNLDELMSLQVDPYYMAPLRPDPASLAALQANTLIESGACSERDLAVIAAARQTAAVANPWVARDTASNADAIMAEPYRATPLRPSTVPTTMDGSAAIVLAAGDTARRYCERPAWIRGIDHRTDGHNIGLRDLATSSSAAIAARRAGVADGPVEVAELHASFAHEEVILREALGLGDDTDINPSGGPLVADPVMATGLIRIGEAADRILRGDARRVLAHATAGPCLQNNLVVVMEASS